MKTILHIDASARKTGSVTRQLGSELVRRLSDGDRSTVIYRDLSEGIGLINEAWVGANFTPASDRTEGQIAALAESDMLIDELHRADVIVFGVPIYNFGVPASLKAWIDLVARAGVTFRYTPDGPVGLLTGKKVHVIVASGGTEIESAMDFATAYMRHVMGFIGIDDVSIIRADRLMMDADKALKAAREQVALAA